MSVATFNCKNISTHATTATTISDSGSTSIKIRSAVTSTAAAATVVLVIVAAIVMM